MNALIAPHPVFIDADGNLEEVRAITLWQPWASFIAFGLKRFETRSWSTSYRGKLLIHAAKRPIDTDGYHVWHEAYALTGQKPGDARLLPLGKVVAIVDLSDCRAIRASSPVAYSSTPYFDRTCQSQLERLCGDWQVGRFAWKLENVQVIEKPIPAKGKQQLWCPEQSLLQEIFNYPKAV